MLPAGGYCVGLNIASGGYGYFPVTTVTNTGGHEYAKRGGIRKTRKEREEERRKFGIIEKILETVAERQTDDLRLDDQQRLDELIGEFNLLGLEYESRYWEIVNIKRQKLIDEEIKSLMRKSEDELVVMMMIAMNL